MIILKVIVIAISTFRTQGYIAITTQQISTKNIVDHTIVRNNLDISLQRFRKTKVQNILISSKPNIAISILQITIVH